MTRSEASFLERALEVGPGARLLDIPCGNGRHALHLAGRGYHLTTVGARQESIAEASGATNTTRWVLGDMCELAWEAEFDGPYCFGNGFGSHDRTGAERFQAAESILPTPLLPPDGVGRACSR